ncbi:MAG: hypothetical protein ACMUEM_06045 [Flavobacteriales bacterium AspAUS03]
MDEFKSVNLGFREIDYLRLSLRMPEVLEISQADIEGCEWQELDHLIDEASCSGEKIYN